MANQLYYELLGTTNNNGSYVTLDGSAQIPVSFRGHRLWRGRFYELQRHQSGSSEDSTPAKNFLSGLKPNQYATNTVGGVSDVTLLVASVGGPDQSYRPFNNTPNVNPWRYVYPGINNPNSYDLWVQLVIAGQNNLVCNWNKQVQINSPLP